MYAKKCPRIFSHRILPSFELNLYVFGTAVQTPKCLLFTALSGNMFHYSFSFQWPHLFLGTYFFDSFLRPFDPTKIEWFNPTYMSRSFYMDRFNAKWIFTWNWQNPNRFYCEWLYFRMYNCLWQLYYLFSSVLSHQ